jgi:outer membrane protein OmpA-like peptidoglycan-associated protein
MRFQLVAAVLALGACHHAKAPVAPVQSEPPPVATSDAKPAPATPVSTNVSASDDLVKQCQLVVSSEQKAPKFDFDHSELTTTDRDVLDQIARCVTSGPLKGRKLQLVGRADPRGTEEYNLSLGDRRAHNVEDYLQRLGVGTPQLAETTRGALDATGTNDTGWREDRRVDLRLL